VGLAGIMGGLRTAVTAETTDVFLESAYFSPMRSSARARLGLQTDASQRFERGVDPTQQGRAIERAIALLSPVAGGTAGPVEVTQSAAHLPRRSAVALRAKQLTRLLGAELPAERIEATLAGLQMQVTRSASGWQVTPAAHRFDIGIEADLIEEVARVVGFEAIPETDALVPQRFRSLPEEQPPEAGVLGRLAARGYQEAITLAFVDPALQERLFPGRAALALSNPIASDLSVMRVSLWPGCCVQRSRISAARPIVSACSSTARASKPAAAPRVSSTRSRAWRAARAYPSSGAWRRTRARRQTSTT